MPSEKATRKRVNTDPEVVKKRKSSKTEEYGNEDDAEETESEISADESRRYKAATSKQNRPIVQGSSDE